MLTISCMSQMVVFLNGWVTFLLHLLKLVNFKIHQVNKVKRKRKIKETITKHFNLALVTLASGISLLARTARGQGRVLLALLPLGCRKPPVHSPGA